MAKTKPISFPKPKAKVPRKPPQPPIATVAKPWGGSIGKALRERDELYDKALRPRRAK